MQACARWDRWLLQPLGLLVGMAAGIGCWTRAEQHCANLEGDATCAGRASGGFCDLCRAEHDGCVSRRPSPECHFAGPDSVSASTGSIGETTTSNATTTTAHEGPEPATAGAMACISDEDCSDPHAPFCAMIQGTCVGCEAMPDPDAACARRDHTQPLCVGGTCVQCTPASAAECDALGLVCDPEAHVCTACVEHEQCGSGACELVEGRCFPSDAVVLEVDDAGAGLPSVGAAVAAIPDGGVGIIRIHARPGGAAYLGTPVIDGGKTIALLAADGGSPSLRGAFAGNPALRVDGGETTVYLDRLVLRGTDDGRGLVVDGGTAWVDRSRIVQNEGGGVLAVAGASLTLRTSFVGGGVSDVAAVEVNGASARVEYATLGGGSGAARALACDAHADVEVRNSVLVAQSGGDAIDCDGTFEYDATELDLGGTNVGVGPMSTQWFAGYGQGNLWLTTEGDATFAGIAHWSEGDPGADIDGDPRPSGHGARDHAGADVP